MYEIIGLVLSGLGLLANIVGLAIPYWGYISNVSHFGLWQICSENLLYQFECQDIPSQYSSDKWKATQALELIGMIGMVVTVVLVLLKMTKMRGNDRLLRVAGAVAIVSGVLMIVGCIIFSTEDHDGYKLHAGFALCIVGGILSIVAGVFNIFGIVRIYTTLP